MMILLHGSLNRQSGSSVMHSSRLKGRVGLHSCGCGVEGSVPFKETDRRSGAPLYIPAD
jgi:hypothetical protein